MNPIRITVEHGRLVETAADALVVNRFEDAPLVGATAEVDAALGGAIARLVASGDFRGRLGEIAVLYPPAPLESAAAPVLRAPRVLLVGLGKQAAFSTERARQAAAAAARRARDLGARTLATKIHGVGMGVLPATEGAQALVEGTILGLYRFDELKSRRADDEDGDEAPKRGGQVEQVVLVEPDAMRLDQARLGAERGRVLAESTAFARDLVNRPGNLLPPRALAEAARAMASEVGLRCEVLEPPQLAELGMGALLGVAQGSAEPARFVILEHAPEGTADQPPVVLCGKGVTFDSGGISIKHAEGMAQMKDDMSGAAAVLGALRALARLGVPRRVIGLVPAVENMPSGQAIRPGDVLRAMDGQTIEVISTDAEGRLILADAIAYAQRYRPAAIVDIATLTGGVVTALGSGAAGMMGNDTRVIDTLKAAARATGERVWELPLWDEPYRKLIRSDVADMKNSGGRQASPIAGGMLLKQFAKQTPWAHIDMAGMSWADSAGPYTSRGGTGFGVRLLAEFAASFAPPPASAGHQEEEESA